MSINARQFAAIRRAQARNRKRSRNPGPQRAAAVARFHADRAERSASDRDRKRAARSRRPAVRPVKRRRAIRPPSRAVRDIAGPLAFAGGVAQLMLATGPILAVSGFALMAAGTLYHYMLGVGSRPVPEPTADERAQARADLAEADAMEDAFYAAQFGRELGVF